MEIFLSENNQNNYVCSNDSDDFIGISEPPDSEPDDISEAYSQYSFAIGVVEDKEYIELSPTTNAANEILKLDLKLHMVTKIMNLLYQEVVYFVKLNLYWLENVMNFIGPSQKNTLSRVSVPQPDK